MEAVWTELALVSMEANHLSFGKNTLEASRCVEPEEPRRIYSDCRELSNTDCETSTEVSPEKEEGCAEP